MRPRFRFRLPWLLVIALASLLVTGCDEGWFSPGERGSGDLVTETRDLTGFDSIEVGSALDLDLRVHPEADFEVIVTFDDNIIEDVVTRVNGDTLVLDLDGSFNLEGDPDRKISVVMPALEAIDASGAADVSASGTTSAYSVDASGASQLDLRQLEATDIEIDVSGASDVDVFATGTVSGSASGASEVQVHGSPVSVLIDSSGVSSVDVAN